MESGALPSLKIQFLAFGPSCAQSECVSGSSKSAKFTMLLDRVMLIAFYVNWNFPKVGGVAGESKNKKREAWEDYSLLL